MEIFLLWLDDLDDLLFGVVLAVERLRWPCLKVGFTAACLLAAAGSAEALAGWIDALEWIALGSVLLWAAAVAIRALSWRTAEPSGSSVTTGA